MTTKSSATTKAKTKSAPAPAPTKVVETAAAAAVERAEAAEKNAAALEKTLTEATPEPVAKAVEQAMTTAQEQVEKASTLVSKNLEDATVAGTSAYEAWMKSSDTLAKGFEQLNASVLKFVQQSFEANVSTANKMISCSNVNEAMELQASHVKSSFDNLLAESSKVGEMTKSVIADAYAPITAQFNSGIEKLWKPRAA